MSTKSGTRTIRYEDDVADALVALVEQGMSATKAAREIGVSRATATRWVRLHRAGRKRGTIGHPHHPGRDEYHRLRQQGLSVTQASKRVGVTSTSGYNWDKEIRKTASVSQPAPRMGREYNQGMRAQEFLSDTDTNPRFLALAEREKIRDLHKSGASMRQIAVALGRDVSTVSRELRRNRDDQGQYLPYGAQRMATLRRARPKTPKLVMRSRLRSYVQNKLDVQWSPAQISATLVREFPDDLEMRVCPETIYQALYLQARGGLKKEVQAALRTGRVRRKSRGQQRQPRVLGDEMLMISQRPAEVEDRAVPGHWEGDLIMGAYNRSAIATLVERKTRYVMLCHLHGDHTAETVAAAVAAQMRTLPQHLRASLTWDQGAEMANHAAVTVAAQLPVYFCDPASPWQRGSNENTNGLLRQYFPKGTDLSVHSPEDLERVAYRLNSRPRETLGWNTPAEKMRDLLLPG